MSILFAVVDLETTGVYNKDRVLEIGLVLMNDAGVTLAEFDTLVNPMRDIGNSSEIHGLEARHLADAPKFEEVAHILLGFLSRADVIVSHNFSFDWRMLSCEFKRLDYGLPVNVNGLCTLQAFQTLDPGCPRHLSALCARYDIPLGRHHSALDDARATAELLKLCLGNIDFAGLNSVSWPKHTPPTTEKLKRRSELTDSGPSYRLGLLERLTSAAPSHAEQASLDSYFELLDRVFADSILEESEAHELLEHAQDLGLSSEEVAVAHETYFKELVAVAVRDGYISELEREHLNAVSHALGLDVGHDNQLETLRLYPRDLNGKSICFSGELRGKINGKEIPRSAAEEIARGLGLEIKGNVSKKLSLLVVKDPYTMSGKAKKAREYRIPLISEQVFWNWAGVQVT